jgi:hypothetical protein
MDGCFPREAENLKLLIEQMPKYNISQGLKLKQCINCPVLNNVNQSNQIPPSRSPNAFPCNVSGRGNNRLALNKRADNKLTHNRHTCKQMWSGLLPHLHSRPSRMSRTVKYTIIIPFLTWESDWQSKHVWRLVFLGFIEGFHPHSPISKFFKNFSHFGFPCISQYFETLPSICWHFSLFLTNFHNVSQCLTIFQSVWGYFSLVQIVWPFSLISRCFPICFSVWSQYFDTL